MDHKVAVVGTGFIGRAWAIAFARAGCRVALYNTQTDAAEAALTFIDGILSDLAANDLLRGQAPEQLRQRIRIAPDLETALKGAKHVQENAPEQLGLKVALFQTLDALAEPDAVIASSTSALLPSRFTEGLAGRARCLVVHPINPPYLVPAVEVVPAPWTEPAIVERTAAFMRGVGQSPIVMRREVDGFVMNRLQGALLQEAFRLVAEGYASTEDVDIGMREGLGLRWAFMGPFETIDLNAPGGVKDYIARYGGLYQNLWRSQDHIVRWSGQLSVRLEAERAALLPRDHLAARQAWRDRRLMALVAHKAEISKKVID
jgi:L-gulonate 3-dehydrogenase